MVKYVNEYYTKITGERLHSVIDVGCGGGWFVKAFEEDGCLSMGIEGSKAGYEACKILGLSGNVTIHDLRHPLKEPVRRFNIAISTENLEHTEEPFAGTVVRTLTQLSDLIWFSSEPYGTNRPHLHHCNEQPHQYWVNLFEFFGYGCMMLPDEVHYATAERGRCIFYNKKVYSNL